MIMKKIILIILVLLWLQSIHAAAKTITANALFDGKAVLTVDGKQLMLSLGETLQGIKLIEANQYRAILEINGQRQNVYLDKSIANDYSASPQLQRTTEGSHVISVNLMHQTRNVATFEVDYFYDTALAEYAVLTAKTLAQGKMTPYWSHSFTRLTPGRNLTTITLSVNDKAPPHYDSDEVQFDIHWIKGEKSGLIGTKIVPFIKRWQQ
jgi:hypothetical protein